MTTKIINKTNLFFNAAKYGNIELVEILISEGVDINAKTDYGITALILAARYGHLEIINLLLENGADINARDDCGNTAVMAAAAFGKSEIVKFLIEKGADIKALVADVIEDAEKTKMLIANEDDYIITNKTNLIFTEIKNGRTSGRTYEMTAQEFIKSVVNNDHDCELYGDDEGIEMENENGNTYTHHEFYDETIEDQLSACVARQERVNASRITFKIED